MSGKSQGWFVLVVLGLFVGPCLHAAPPVERAVFVAAGSPLDILAPRETGTQHAEMLELAGKGAYLRAGKFLGPGNFEIEVELAVADLGGNAATMMLNDNHFGWEGAAGEMFVEGPLFGKQLLGPTVVSEDAMFSFHVVRKNDLVQFLIDGEVVFATRLENDVPVHLALRPWRSRLRVHTFWARGNLMQEAEPLSQIVVFRSGDDGYHTYRIPATVRTTEGTVLAFAEGRTGGGGDSGNIDLVLRRSFDQGKTWTKTTVVWDGGDHTCGNPCPVVDEQTGTIWLAMTWNRGSDHESQIMAGTSSDVRHVYVTSSEDDGLTWAEPRKISDQVRQPHWRWYATGPGNAIQLRHGPHRGRLLFPANHSDHSKAGVHPYRSHVFWSDDHGVTWQLGGIHAPKTNESVVVELPGGELLQSMRSYHGQKNRAMSRSHDGGATWDAVYLDDALRTPVCQGSLIRLTWVETEDVTLQRRLLYCSPAGPGRNRLTLRMSYDAGSTWPLTREIYPGSAAYSNLVMVADDQVGLLYERDGYQTIRWTSLPLDSLK